jgi:anti-anti-sigma factor
MHNKFSQLPQDIYHRLYWYVQRKVDPKRIAAALNLPVKTVQNLIDRLNAEKKEAPAEKVKVKPEQTKGNPVSADFMDIYIFAKTRYTIIDISGSIDKQHTQKLRDELVKISASDRKPLALKMSDVVFIDDYGIQELKNLYVGIKYQNGYCAILDPSLIADEAIKRYGLDEIIPVFGTEIAFEEHAFRLSGG